MRLDDIRIPIEPRTLGECVDLSAAYLRRYGARILPLTFVFWALAMLLGWLITPSRESALLIHALLFFLCSKLLGSALVVCVGYHVFGAPFRVRDGLIALARHGVRLTIRFTSLGVVTLVLLCFGGLPGLLFGVAVPFVPELLLLEQLKGKRSHRRTRDLLRNSYGALVVRAGGLILVGCVLWLGAFATLDMGCAVLFERPVFLGRIADFAGVGLLASLLSEPEVIFLSTFCLWLVYPLLRVAWFFCYLDIRIRGEAWDVELDFRREAQRLEEVVA